MRLDRRLSIASTTSLGNRVRFEALAFLFLGLLALTAGSSGAQGPVWTDDTPVPGVTPIKATHFTELRTRINELLTGCGGTAFTFTDVTLNAREPPVRAVHVIELNQIGAFSPTRNAAEGRGVTPAPRDLHVVVVGPAAAPVLVTVFRSTEVPHSWACFPCLPLYLFRRLRYGVLHFLSWYCLRRHTAVPQNF